MVSASLCIRNGLKFTKKVDEMSGKVIEKRVIAKKMSEYFDDHRNLYVQMKGMIMTQLNNHDPFSDDVLLSVIVYAKPKFQGVFCSVVRTGTKDSLSHFCPNTISLITQ